MFFKFDNLLAGVVVSLNFFLMVLQENSLYAILPKYFSNQTSISARNETVLINSTVPQNCSFQKPPYVVVSQIFLSKNVAMIFLNIFIGIIIYKLNIYIILILSHFVGIGVSFIYAYTDTLLLYIIGRVLDSFITCGILIGIYFLISKLFIVIEVRDRYYALVNIIYFISHSIGPFYGAEVDERFGKSTVFLILVPLWIVCLLLTVFLYWRNRNRSKRSEIKLEGQRQKPNLESLDECINEANVQILDKAKMDIFVQNSRKKTKTLNIIYKFIRDPFVMLCLGQLFVVNLSMYSLPPTLPSWMASEFCSSEIEQGIVWTFGFLGYIVGVVTVIIVDKHAYRFRYYVPVVGHLMIGILMIILPFSRDWKMVFLPIVGMYVGVGFVDQIVIPLTINLAIFRHKSNTNIVSSLTSQSLTISSVISTLLCGHIVMLFGFHFLTITLGIINLIFSPISLYYRKLDFQPDKNVN
uniref:Slc18a-8 n=1 Tax=Schmidtea mediterranea TaxID=79327 RepID=A0A0H3YK88_SCHMD|nr:slc18a-8 [Schmidtea mediterranea]